MKCSGGEERARPAAGRNFRMGLEDTQRQSVYAHRSGVAPRISSATCSHRAINVMQVVHRYWTSSIEPLIAEPNRKSSGCVTVLYKALRFEMRLQLATASLLKVMIDVARHRNNHSIVRLRDGVDMITLPNCRSYVL